MFEKILVPLDTSPFAEQVVPPVIDLACAFNSQTDLINICEERDEQEAPSCNDYLEKIARQISKATADKNLPLKQEILTGSPAPQILAYAREQNSALIVMSSHGLSGVTLWPLGSTVDKVIRSANQPILIIRVNETGEVTPREKLFRRILVPLDGSELGSRVVPYAAAIAAKFGSEVVLIHVIETDKRLHSLGRIDTVPIREDEMVLLKKHSQELLNRELPKFSTPSVKSVSVSGNVAEEIIKYYNQNDCSLVALSSHGHSGFETWIIGSVTNKILHSGKTSLLFVPATDN